jgi:hypothetical protein
MANMLNYQKARALPEINVKTEFDSIENKRSSFADRQKIHQEVKSEMLEVINFLNFLK